MQNIAKHIHLRLLKKHRTLAVAESCTGGLLSKLLTDLAGSSGYFILGVVAYNNKVKNSILKVPVGIIEKQGAVSDLVCRKMAENVRRIAKADLGIGITGIAGPTGGSPLKPTGTVYIAVATPKKTICKRLQLRASRSAIRIKAALEALKLLYKQL